MIFEYVLFALLGVLALYLAFVALSVLGVGLSCLAVRKKEYTKNSRFFRALLNFLTEVVLFFLGVRVDASGKEKLPRGRFLLVSNHRSNFDPIVAWRTLKEHDMAFISKASNLNIPLFGRLARRNCFLEIDRKNPRKAAETIEKAAALLVADECSVGVYPEGTRSKTGELLPFHNAVFKVAQKANVPIVVALTEGTEKIAKRTPWRRTRVKFTILEVIPAEEVTAVKTAEIGERVRKIITEAKEKKA